MSSLSYFILFLTNFSFRITPSQMSTPFWPKPKSCRITPNLIPLILQPSLLLCVVGQSKRVENLLWTLFNSMSGVWPLGTAFKTWGTGWNICSLTVGEWGNTYFHMHYGKGSLGMSSSSSSSHSHFSHGDMCLEIMFAVIIWGRRSHNNSTLPILVCREVMPEMFNNGAKIITKISLQSIWENT